MSPPLRSERGFEPMCGRDVIGFTDDIPAKQAMSIVVAWDVRVVLAPWRFARLLVAIAGSKGFPAVLAAKNVAPSRSFFGDHRHGL